MPAPFKSDKLQFNELNTTSSVALANAARTGLIKASSSILFSSTGALFFGSTRIALSASQHGILHLSASQLHLSAATVYGNDIYGQFSGSLTKTKTGISYLVAGDNLTISSASSGQITLSVSTGSNNTLDQAYDQGGAGVGSKITVDNAPVQMQRPASGVPNTTALVLTGTLNLVRLGGAISATDGVFLSCSNETTLRTKELHIVAADIALSASAVHMKKLHSNPNFSGIFDANCDLDAQTNFTVDAGLGGDSDITIRGNNATPISIISTADKITLNGENGVLAKVSKIELSPDDRSLINISGTNVNVTGTVTFLSNRLDKVQFLDTAVALTASESGVLYVSATKLYLSASIFATRLTGSLTQTESGVSYLAAGSNVTITSASNGQVTITATGDVTNLQTAYNGGQTINANTVPIQFSASQGNALGLDTALAITGALQIVSSQSAAGVEGKISLWHNGTNAFITSSVGNIEFTSTPVVIVQLSGSLTRTSAGVSYLTEGTNITIASASNGQVTITSLPSLQSAADNGQSINLSASSTTPVQLTGSNGKQVLLGITGTLDIKHANGRTLRLRDDGVDGYITVSPGSLRMTASGEEYHRGAGDTSGTDTFDIVHGTAGRAAALWLAEGTSNSAAALISANFALDQVLFGLHLTRGGNQLIVGNEAFYANDFDHVAQGEPTLYIHSNTNPDTNNTQYLELKHDGNNAYLKAGTGGINIVPAVATTSSLTVNGALISNAERVHDFVEADEDNTFPFTISANSEVAFMKPVTAHVTGVLPDPTTLTVGTVFRVIDATGNASSTATIVISGNNGTKKIAGGIDAKITTAYGVRAFIASGSQYLNYVVS